MAELPHPLSDEAFLDKLQQSAFDYFLESANPANGLIADTTRDYAPASIAVVGFALSAYPVGVERGWMSRADAAARTLASGFGRRNTALVLFVRIARLRDDGTVRRQLLPSPARVLAHKETPYDIHCELPSCERVERRITLAHGRSGWFATGRLRGYSGTHCRALTAGRRS